MFSNFLSYLSESIKELKKVNWLSASETARMTGQVIIFAFIFAVIFGLADATFLKLIYLR